MCEVEVRELKENCEDPMGDTSDRIKTQNKESQPSWDQIIFDRDSEWLEKLVFFLIQQFEFLV